MKRLHRWRELLAFDNKFQLITERLLFRGTNLQVYRIGSLEMIVDHRAADTASIRTCIADDMYKTFLRQVDVSGALNIVDLGANVGGFSCLLKVLGLKIKRLLCVEMNPNTCERLRFNILTNFLIDANVVNAAVCGVRRDFELPLGIGSTNDNIYQGHRGGQTKTVQSVHGLTLDDLCNTYMPDEMIDICKMDIEGAEAEILTSNSSDIRSLDRCRYLLIEMHPVDKYDEMFKVILDKGFTFVSHEGKHKCGVHLFKNSRIESRAEQINI